MIDEKTLLDLCEYIVKTGKERGAEHIEVQAMSESEVESDVEMGQISQVSKKSLSEVAIRLHIGKKMGCAFTNIPTRDAADEALGLAISAAKATTDDEAWSGFPSPADSYPVIEGLWQDSVMDSDSGEIVGLGARALSLITEAEPGLIPGFGGSAAIGFSAAYANSNGVSHSDKGTLALVVLGGIAPTETGMTPMVFSYDISRDMNVDIEGIVDDVASAIRICKNSVMGTTGKHTVIMHPFAYGQIMQYTLIQSIRGDNVARGKSRIGDKLGEKIASERVTIIDDGLHPRGVSSSSADDEGVPRRRTPIIEKGVLRSFLWDTYWARKMGVKSTGNAKRNMRQGLVEISPSNIVVETGERDIKDIIKGIKHGYYIRGVQGAHSSNPESGDFSIVGNPAILIKNGEMIGAVHGLMVAGNIYDLLNQVDEVAKKPHYLEGIIGPDIVFSDVSLIAKE
jgi:PmbA protein